MRLIQSVTFAGVVAMAALSPPLSRSAAAASAAELRRDSSAELNKLYARQSSAKYLGQRARGILIFPAMVNAVFSAGTGTSL